MYCFVLLNAAKDGLGKIPGVSCATLATHARQLTIHCAVKATIRSALHAAQPVSLSTVASCTYCVHAVCSPAGRQKQVCCLLMPYWLLKAL